MSPSPAKKVKLHYMRALLFGLALPTLCVAYQLLPKTGTAAATCAALDLVPVDVTPAEAAAIAAAIKASPAAGNTAEIGAWWGKVFNAPCVSAIAYAASSSLSLSLSCASHVVCGPPPYAGNLTKTTTTATSTIPQTDVVTETSTTTIIDTLSSPTTTTTTATQTNTKTSIVANPPVAPTTYPALPDGSAWNAAGTFAYVNESSTFANAANVCGTYGLRLAAVNDFSQVQIGSLVSKNAWIAPQLASNVRLYKGYISGAGDLQRVIAFYNPESTYSFNRVICGKVDSNGLWIYEQFYNLMSPNYNGARTMCQQNFNSGIAIIPGTGIENTIVNSSNGFTFVRASTPFKFECPFRLFSTQNSLEYQVAYTFACPGTTTGVLCMSRQVS